MYLEDKEQFLLDAGHSIELFKSRFNAYAIKLEGKVILASSKKTAFQKNREVIDDWANSRDGNNSGGILDVDCETIPTGD